MDRLLSKLLKHGEEGRGKGLQKGEGGEGVAEGEERQEGQK